MTSFQQPDEIQKTHALGVVYYEIEEFCYCCFQLKENASLDQSSKNALIESMLIHVRVLRDFFERSTRSRLKGEEQDDALSTDFGFPNRSLNLPEDYSGRINKDVAHLTYSRAERVTPEQKGWDLPALLPLVERSMEFIDSRSEEELRRLAEYRLSNNITPLLSWPNLRLSLLNLRRALEPGTGATGPTGPTGPTGATGVVNTSSSGL